MSLGYLLAKKEELSIFMLGLGVRYERERESRSTQRINAIQFDNPILESS